MTTQNNSVTIKVEPSGQYYIEQYIDNVCDKLHINEVYYGNLLTGINVLFSLLIESQVNTHVTIGYKTDYHNINVEFKGVSRETVELIDQKAANVDGDDQLVILNNLTEDVMVNEDKISLVFNIGAMNYKIYQVRKKLLNDYFNGLFSLKSIPSHDNF